MITTPGRILINSILPEGYKQYSQRELDKKTQGELATKLARNNPEKYIKTMHGFSRLAREVNTTYGKSASVGLEDLKTPEELIPLKRKIHGDIDTIKNNPSLTADEKKKKTIEYLQEAMKVVPGKVAEVLKKSNSGFAMQFRSGARGNPVQLMQTIMGPLLLTDAQGKPVPIPNINGYGTGTTPLEYWGAANGARKGTVDVQFATADGGYFAKRANNIGIRTVVTEDDCGTKNGLIVKGDDPDNIGSILAKPAGGLPAGTLITKENLNKLHGQDIIVRSLTTCQAKEGVCAKCAGKREDNDFPAIGTKIGIIAARAVGEQVTQAALGSKHKGGVSEGKPKEVEGFAEIDQFIQIPSTFRGGAVLASKDGYITNIRDNPGKTGKIVTVGNEEHFVPNGRDIVIHKGDFVEAGDVLTDGTPNPAELARHKGVGEGRRYFVNMYSKILNDNNASVHRRNVESFARSLINRVEITKPEGYNGHMMGDVVPYDIIARDYQPRESSQRVRVSGSLKGTYLEQPVLHYTIGTRITPSVIKTLANHGIGDIVVNADEPAFKPKVVRSVDVLKTDPDWMTRLAGEGLKKAMLDAAQFGSTSVAKGTSYIPDVSDATNLERIDKPTF